MRPRRPRGSITRDGVVEAALEVIDRGGVEALTIRAVATATGAPPMSLYAHFSSKEELLDLMHAEVSRRLYPDTGQRTWEELMLAVARQIRQTFLEHPHWAALLSRATPPTPMPTSMRERMLTMMTASGIAPPEALRRISTVVVAAIGFSLVELTFREPDGTSALTRRFEHLRTSFEQAESPAEPISREAFAGVRQFDLSETFEEAIRSLISGKPLGTRTTEP